jgi:uncharacterized protein YdcH (DUF465 family)
LIDIKDARHHAAQGSLSRRKATNEENAAMSAHTPHELHDEFPHDARVLHLLKLADAHFCNLAERYHALNRAIHRIECEVEASSDDYLTRLRRQRLALLDEIAEIIETAEADFAPVRADASPTLVLEAANDQPAAVPA